MDIVKDFTEWVVAVVEHWEGYVSGGVIAFALEVGERLREWKVPKKVYLLILALGLIGSLFAAWRDEHLKVLSQKSYVKAWAEPMYSPGSFPPDRQLAMNVYWKVAAGNYPAFNAIEYAASYFTI